MTEPIAILSGQTVPISDARISVFDAGFAHGVAVADMIRTFHHKPFRLDDHLARLREGVSALEISDAPTDDVLQDAISHVLEQNSRLIPSHHDLGIIVFVTTGLNKTYLGAAAAKAADECTWGVHSFPLPFEFWAEKMQHGQHLVVPPFEHIPAVCLNPQIKWRSRVHWFLADRWVRKTHSHAAALLCDANGHFTETSTANLILVKNGKLRTPHEELTLNGISRRVTLELAEKLGIEWSWANLTPEDLLNADEIFTSSTPYSIMPVTRFNDSPVGTSEHGEVFLQLMTAWNDLARLDIMGQIRVGARERG
jgi:branched-chain amino acid aminotransferase